VIVGCSTSPFGQNGLVNAKPKEKPATEEYGRMTLGLVDNYFKTIGVRHPKSEAVYLKQGLKRFGKRFQDLTSIIGARADGASINPYDLKNSSLELSLYVGEHFASPMWREFASWLVRENLEDPSQVLDLGCENGVLTCFYASLWPNAKVVGIEQSDAAVTAARKLALNLGLANVSFENAEAHLYLSANSGRFDIIMATHSMHEILERDRARKPFQWDREYERIEDVVLTDADAYTIETLKHISAALAENGLFISLDRSPTEATMWWYAQCFEAAGMKISLSRSYSIECQGQRFPLIVARRTRSGEARVTANEIVSLASFKKFADMKLSFKEELADVMVRSFGPTETMFEAVCTFVDGSGVRTLRLLKAPTLLVLHDFTNHGFQHASLAPLVALPNVLQQCATIATELEAHCIVKSAVTEDGRRWLARLDCPVS
jgi:precorrin-6B methylase 2